MNQDDINKIRWKLVTHLDDVAMDLLMLQGAERISTGQGKSNPKFAIVISEYMKYRTDLESVVNEALGIPNKIGGIVVPKDVNG